jgi:tetratricopeptide (TPR) repeat protein
MVKRVNIRVAMSISGKVVSGGKGVPDAQLILTDITGEKELGKTKSDAKGEFSLEFPQNIVSRLVVRKPGYCFSPLHRVFDFQGKSERVVFKGAKATIQDIMLTSSADSNEPLKNLCPGDQAYFKAGYKTNKRVMRVETSLVQPTPSGKIRELLGEAIEAANVPNTLDPNSAQALNVKVPRKLKTGVVSDHYSLVVTYYDTEGNSFSGMSENQIRVSPSQCALAYTVRGAEAQMKGDQEKALEMYNKAEEYSSSSPSLQEDAMVQEARLFNRGLAHLALAISAKRESSQEISHINKALADFAEVLKLHRTDAESYLMRGVARYLRQNYTDAVDEISKCLRNAPGMTAAYKIRAMAYLQTRDPSNLSKAVDDFTAALDKESDNENTRKIRSLTLIHDIELSDKIKAEKASPKKDSDSGEKIEIDLGKTPLPDLREIIDVKSFARRVR